MKEQVIFNYSKVTDHYTVKRVAIFPSPAGMSLTKLSLAWISLSNPLWRGII
jgi:hypothetical protein